MSVFFAPDFEQHLTHFQLNEDESKHSVKVLRMQVGAEIRLINGRGLEAICQIQDAQPKRVYLQFFKRSNTPKRLNCILQWRLQKTWIALSGF